MGEKLEIMERMTRKEYSTRFRIPSGCAVFGVVNQKGMRFSGQTVLEGITMMHDRSNGLGGGFAAYGIYPRFAQEWAFHLIYEDRIAQQQAEDLLGQNFEILLSEEIPTDGSIRLDQPPLNYRYFLRCQKNMGKHEQDFIVNLVMNINSNIRGAFVVSSGKNMGIFKGVGYPEDIGRYYRIQEYEGYLWTSHGRFPTNSAGWWGGAHPFGLLNWSVVHNGEISSYGSNKRFVNDFGYKCTLSTDTEVIAYLFDLLVRREKIDLRLLHLILAAPLWEEIERLAPDIRKVVTALRTVYGPALLNGPFNIIIGHNDFMYALNDRIKLRPMVAARHQDYMYVSSEEAAIRKVCPSPSLVWRPEGGQPVIGRVSIPRKAKLNQKAGV